MLCADETWTSSAHRQPCSFALFNCRNKTLELLLNYWSAEWSKGMAYMFPSCSICTAHLQEQQHHTSSENLARTLIKRPSSITSCRVQDSCKELITMAKRTKVSHTLEKTLKLCKATRWKCGKERQARRDDWHHQDQSAGVVTHGRRRWWSEPVWLRGTHSLKQGPGLGAVIILQIRPV